MPDWTGLTSALANVAGVDESSGGPAVASAYERKFGRVQLIEAIRRALYSDEVEPGRAHLVFAHLPFDTVYTTNFDLLIEEAYSRIRRPFRSLVGELQLPFHGGPLTTNIVKMHGDLRHEEHIIITAEDYSAFLEQYPVIATHLSALLITRTPLFIGYSLTDPDFQNIRAVVRSRLGKFERMAYVVTFDTLPPEIEQRLNDRINVVTLSTSTGSSRDDLLAEFLQEIQDRADVKAGTRLRAARPGAFEDLPEETIEEAVRESDASALLASSSNLCFAMMPFRPDFDAVYAELIRPVAEAAGLTVIRADEMSAPGAITEQIRGAIQQSRVCIADLTGRNPNVLYEVGIAHTMGKPTVLLTQSADDLPFDIAGLRVIIYALTEKGVAVARDQLARALNLVLGEDRFDEAARLIEAGMYRAAAAILGVLLEHNMAHLTQSKEQVPVSSIGRRLTLGQMVRQLMGEGRLDSHDAEVLMRVVAIRNKAVHELEEPTEADVRFGVDAARGFIAKYLTP